MLSGGGTLMLSTVHVIARLIVIFPFSFYLFFIQDVT